MRIKKLRLKNGYKRFFDLTIDLGDNPARIIALVGPNGSGKSSVLDGLLYHQNAYNSLGSTGVRAKSYHFMEGSIDSGHDNIEIYFLDGKYSDMRRRRDQCGKPNTVFSFRSPYRYNSNLRIKEIRSTVAICENNYGATDASSLDSKMEENYRRLQGMVNRYMQENDVKPSEARAKIIGELNSSIKACLDLEIASVGNVEANQGTIYFKKADHKNEFEFNVLSSGEKEVIDILLDLYLRKIDYNDSIFLIDEPELHINTSIQSNLLAEIDKLVGDSCQIWLTTHSIGFLRALQTNMKTSCQIIQFKNEYQLASKPYVLTPMKANAAGWRDLFSVALDDLAALVSPRTIIYCEGRDRPGSGGAERGMDARAFNAIFGESHPEALFVSSGGNTELDQRSAIAIAILGKIFPSVEILVLKDRDMASGKGTTESDRLIYLNNNPNNHRVMKRYEIENYLYDRDVLKNYCSQNGLLFNESAYDGFITDIVNQNLKDETGRIKNICGIGGSVSPETFKISLAGYLTQNMTAFSELSDCIFKRA